MKKHLLFIIALYVMINSVLSQTVNQNLDLYLPFNGDLQNHSSIKYDLISDAIGSFVEDRFGRERSAFKPENSDWFDDLNQLIYKREDSIVIQNNSSFSLSIWVYGLENERSKYQSDLFFSNCKNCFDIYREPNFGFGNGDIEGIAAGGGFYDYYNQSFDELILGTGSESSHDPFTEWDNQFNGWHHVAVTNSNDSMKLYLDAVKITAIKKQPNQIYDFTRTFLVGQVFNDYTIDDVAFYTSELSLKDINAIYNENIIISALHNKSNPNDLSGTILTTGKVAIKSDHIVQMKLHNDIGTVIKTSNNGNMDISNSANGIYFLQIKTQERIHLVKIIKV